MKNLYKNLFSYVQERKKYAYLSITLAAISVFVFIAFYWVFWIVVKSLLVDANYSLALDYSFKLVILMIFRGVLIMSGTMASHYVGFRLERNLRTAGLKGLMNASFSFFDKNSSGEIRRIIDDNAANTHQAVAHLIPNTVVAILTPILMFTLAFKIDYRQGILLVITSIIGILQYKGMFKRMDLMEKSMNSLQEMSAATVEYIRGMQVIKIFGVTVKYYKSMLDSIMNYKNYTYKYSQSCRIPNITFQVLFNLFYAFCVPFAIFYISKGENTLLILAKVIYFAVFSSLLLSSFSLVMSVATDTFKAKDAVKKLEDALIDMNDNKINYGSLENIENYNIEFKNVSFGYEKEMVLEHFNLLLPENKTYALVGPSGGGKSTIAKLISGFYKINDGEILIGGRDLKEYSEKVLLENIAFVFQNSKLFKTSIYENVRIGKPNASYEEVMRALEAARCSEILDKFKERENTIIGSKGVYLSGGEVQRIAIARAILKDAKIIILDEASAAADPENEYELQKAFSVLMKNKTVIMIAHRLSSIKNVDEVLYIEDGHIVERGSDSELMKLEGKYKALQDLYNKANEWRVA